MLGQFDEDAEVTVCAVPRTSVSTGRFSVAMITVLIGIVSIGWFAARIVDSVGRQSVERDKAFFTACVDQGGVPTQKKLGFNNSTISWVCLDAPAVAG